MTKMMGLIAAIVLLFASLMIPAGPAATQPEPEPLTVEMTGIVQEMGEGYLLILRDDGSRVQVNIDPDGTLFEGKAPETGDLIHVLYNGAMTRSLPPQITAQRIGCYVRTGAIVELTSTGFTLDDGAEIIEVHAEAALTDGLEPGSSVTVYFNGVMTMSLPAQINAGLIIPAAK